MLCNFAELVVREVEKKHVVRISSLLTSLLYVPHPVCHHGLFTLNLTQRWFCYVGKLS